MNAQVRIAAIFMPPTTGEQGNCVRDENMEKESDEIIALFNERNERLLNLFVGLLDKNTTNQIYRFWCW